MKKHRLSLLDPVFWLLLLSASCAAAAQAFSTDTIEKGRFYLEGNLWTATQRHRDGGMQNYGARAAFGVTKNVEVGLGGAFSQPYDAEYPPEIQPSVKWKFYKNEKWGLQAAGGALAFVPIARKTGTDAFVMLYGNVSKDFKAFKAPRLTVGYYALAGRNPQFGSRRGFSFVYDQPLGEKLAFSAQWVTGKNRFGYLTPGLSVKMPRKSSLYVGYSVGNFDYDNHGPYFSYSIVR